jgi:glycosyltransferase involved in cell wall biosynthesis
MQDAFRAAGCFFLASGISSIALCSFCPGRYLNGFHSDAMANNKPNISLFFPVYNDEKTVRIVAKRALELLEEVADNYEVIIVNDGSPDSSGAIADQLASENEAIIVVHHPENRGYGAAMKTGIAASKYDIICMIDGDNEYDVFDLKKMLAVKDYYMLIIAFRYKKLYSTKRIFISFIYNTVLRVLFNSRFRDISTGIRLIHRAVVNDIELTSNSPFIGAELTLKSMLRGFPVGEVGIQTFPRDFGQGSATSFKNIMGTIRDIWRIRKEIFSDHYDLPEGRTRG